MPKEPENEKKPSEVLQEFVDWLKQCQDEYEGSKAIIREEEAKEVDFFHAIEFETKSKQRSKITTIFHNSLVRRRVAKDRMQILEKVVLFSRKENSKLFFRELKRIIKEQEAEEERIFGEREYKPRTDAFGGIQNDPD